MGKSTDEALRLLQESGLEDVRFKRVFSVRHSCVYGHNQALMIQQLYYWYKKAIVIRKPEADGRVWFYHSYREWIQEFPFLTEKSFRRWMAQLDEIGIISRRLGGKNSHNRVTWYTFNLDVLAIDFSQKWIEYKSKHNLNIHDENDEKDNNMYDISVTVPYDLSFSGTAFSQIHEVMMTASSGHDDRREDLDTLYIYYKDYLKEILCRCVCTNSEIDSNDEVAECGELDFHIVWDFYHTLLFGRPKEGKDRAALKFKKLSQEEREGVMNALIDYWFNKELTRASKDVAPFEARNYTHKFSNFLSECLSNEYEAGDFYERFRGYFIKQTKKREEAAKSSRLSLSKIHESYKKARDSSGIDPSLT